MNNDGAPHPFDDSAPLPEDADIDEPEDFDDEYLRDASFFDAELIDDWDEDEELPDSWDADGPSAILEAEPEIVADLDDDLPTATPSVIVLSGSRTGTIVARAGDLADHTSNAGPVARMVGRAAAALAPGEVVMLVHQPGRYGRLLPNALARVHADFTSSGLHLGASAGLPRKGAAKTKEYLERCAAAAVRVADPECYLLPNELISFKTLSAKQLENIAYASSAPAGSSPADDAWNEQVVRAQREAGANLLLTPGRWMDPTDPVAALADAGRALDVLLGLAEAGEVPAWNMTVPASWLTTPALRDQLLADLVDRDDVDVWHIRVRWPLPKTLRSFGQLNHAELIGGYKELAETAQREDRALVLPNSGLTGWLTLGWGSVGYGTGPSQATQAWAESPLIRAKKGAPRTTINRQFVAPLLHTITVDSHRNLGRTLPSTSYPTCPCPFCETLAGSPTWLPEIAAAHAVYAMGQLAAEVASAPPDERAPRISRTVMEAATLHARLPDGSRLDAKESPEHLARWTDLLG